MNGYDLNELIKNADPVTLWALVCDVTEVMEKRKYKAERGNTPFMFWYEIYKALETEIDRKLLIDYVGGFDNGEKEQ